MPVEPQRPVSAQSTRMKTARTELAGKRVGMVVLSSYPQDPRPRRAAEAFAQEGMHVDYICCSDGDAPAFEQVNGLDVYRLPIVHQRGGKMAYAREYSTFITASAARLVRQAFRRPYDLIYINNMPDVLVASALVPKWMGAKVILDLHDPMPELMTTIFGVAPESKTIRLLKWLEKWSMARAHQVLTVNIACQKIFAARSCPAEKIGVIMNTPDEEIFPYRPARSYAAESRPAGKPFVVMYHGSLVERNGVDLAVEAVARMRDRMPSVQLHIYGKATPFVDKVMQSARERGLEKNVLHMGRRSLEGIVDAIRNCDLGVIPNQRNAFTDINTPTRIFEYLALGKPLIAPRTPGITDYFDDDSMLYFESGNADQLADRILFAAAHPAEMIDIAERGQRVYDLHRWQQERETLLTLVRNLLAEGN